MNIKGETSKQGGKKGMQMSVYMKRGKEQKNAGQSRRASGSCRTFRISHHKNQRGGGGVYEEVIWGDEMNVEKGKPSLCLPDRHKKCPISRSLSLSLSLKIPRWVVI